jgi:uncharacterized protein YcaQ
MVSPHRLNRSDARRVAVRAQLLDRQRPTDLHDVLRHLTLLQDDATKAIAPSAHLVLWSRLGSSYSPAHLEAALAERTVIELRGMLRPAEDLSLYTADMAEWPGIGELRNYKKTQRDWVAANDFCRRDILRRLRESGPMTAAELPDTCVKPWASSGWNNNRNVTMLVALMVQRGEIASTGIEGRNRLWDLAERVYPERQVVPAGDAKRIRDERRLRSLGIARGRSAECPVEPADVGEAGEPAVVDGVSGEWRVDPEQLDKPFGGRAALLSPFDRLLFDRNRMVDLFEYEYALEMYMPAPKRRWGYYALPILYGDRLVGKLDATTDRRLGELRVDAVHEDVTFTKAMAAAVDIEIADLADWVAREIIPMG